MAALTFNNKLFTFETGQELMNFILPKITVGTKIVTPNTKTELTVTGETKKHLVCYYEYKGKKYEAFLGKDNFKNPHYNNGFIINSDCE